MLQYVQILLFGQRKRVRSCVSTEAEEVNIRKMQFVGQNLTSNTLTPFSYSYPKAFMTYASINSIIHVTTVIQW